MLHIVSGLTSPDSGDILVDNADLSTFSDRNLTLFRRRRLGLVFQAFNLIGALTAEENISLPLLADGRSDLVQERLSPLLDRLGLASRKTHRPDALSGGEQQRVAIARALINRPGLVLADEPTGNLDHVTGGKVLDMLLNLCKERRQTMLVFTHDQDTASRADRIVKLVDGQIAG